MSGKIVSLLIIFGSLFAGGCIREDNSSCEQEEVRIRFTYLNNDEQTNLFGDEVDGVAVLVFDQQGRYVKSKHVVGTHLTNDYSMYIPLRAGVYTFVAWGGVLDRYDFIDLANPATNRPLREGVTTINNLRIMLKGNQVVTRSQEMEVSGLTALFNGVNENYSLTEAGANDVNIDLTKDTHQIIVTISGLDNLADVESTPGVLPLDVFCFASNGMYRYNNTADVNSLRLKYLVDNGESTPTTMVSSTVMLRLLLDTEIGLNIVTHTTRRVIIDENVMSMILRNPAFVTQDDIDREDEYHLNFNINNNSTVTVTVNGWKVIDAIPIL